ncbi:general secretion pathway protein GspK [Thiolapillus sp.]|uniref:general secretion pathway protein GspK n=2 Tax=Thiolapillus sp. TaxID=2017437 RepID=UPI0025D8585F|nr:type II secretion system protein GspK [Thiolapillus sp.]
MMQTRRQQGIALVLVLWVIVLLSVIAGAMSTVQRTGVAMTGNIRQEREGRALVSAGLNFMALMLERRSRPIENNPWPMDGRLHPWNFAGRTIWIGAMPENARIDINRVDDKVLLSLLRSMGLEEEQALAVRDAIVDWRDPDNATHAEGAEDREYRSEGRPIGARDAYFLSIEELQQVLGITADMYKKLAGALTVDARQRTVNPAFASREVLLATPGVTPQEVDQYLADRQQALDQGLPVPQPPFGGAFLKKGRNTRFRLFAEVDLPGGGKSQGEMVVGMESKTRKGYMLLQKKFGKLPSLGCVALPEEEG